MYSEFKKLRLSVFLLLLVIGNVVGQTTPLVPVQKITNPLARKGDNFGQGIAIAGDTIAISSRDDDTLAVDGGLVYLFTDKGDPIGSFGSPDAQSGGFFGNYMTSVGEDHFLVGANKEDDDAGNAYLFDKEGNLVKSFSSPNPFPRAEFGGRFVLANEDFLFIPSWTDPFEDADGIVYTGAVYKYDLNGELLGKISHPAPDDDRVNCLGRSAAFVGSDRILVGDACNNGPEDLDESGAAFLFDLDGNLLQSFYNPKPALLDQFGSSVAYADGRILIGGTQIDDLETDASTGAAYIYETDGTLVTRVSDPEPQGGNWFGWNASSMTLESGEEVFLIGSQFNSTIASNAGKAFLVNRDGEIVQTLASPDPGRSEHFGGSFAQHGNRLFVREGNDDGGFPNGFGAVWIFEPADLGDFDLDGDVDITDLETLCGDLVTSEITQSLDITGDDLIDHQDLTRFLEFTGRLSGDADFDGQVTFADFLTLSDNFGEADAAAWSEGDFNCSGDVGFDDFLQLSSNFGRRADPISVAEPQSTKWLALLLLVGFQRFRKRIRRSN